MTDRGKGSKQRDGKGPRIPGKEALKAPLPKRFYKLADVVASASGHTITLDGRAMKTPGKRAFVVPTEALARAIADEWAAQKDVIDPATMPLTRIANSAIDVVADSMREVADDIAAYAGSDLLCYRAEAPRELALRQAAAWDPLLSWAASCFGIRFEVVAGVLPVQQPAAVKSRVLAALDENSPFELSGLHVLTTLTGSAVLALAHAEGRISAAEAWAAAHVDEDWQIEHWGEDTEARKRRLYLEKEFLAASRLLKLV
jgi:chaperone required for assembly of F1-ATPase